MSASGNGLGEMKIDTGNLYREENYTDLKIASIRKLIPIKIDGSDDDSREPSFLAQTNIMSQMGPVPVNCELEAKTLEEAIEKFPASVETAVNKMIEEAKERQRQEANKIVVPDAGSAGAGGKIDLS